MMNHYSVNVDHKDRSNQELFDAGAYDVVKNYKDMLSLINKLWAKDQIL